MSVEFINFGTWNISDIKIEEIFVKIVLQEYLIAYFHRMPIPHAYAKGQKYGLNMKTESLTYIDFLAIILVLMN